MTQMNIHFKQLIQTVLRSFSQIMLQNNAATGLLFCIGIGINSPTMLLGGITAILTSLVTAKLCRYNIGVIQREIYGFNAALVGIAAFFFLPVSIVSFFLLIFAAFLSTIISHFMQIKAPNIPTYTAPFVLSTWLLLLIIEVLKKETVVTATVPHLSKNTIGDFYGEFHELFYEVSLMLLRGIAQVMQQDYWLSGLIFIAALFVSTYKAAVWAVIGSAAGILIAQSFSYPESAILMGNYSLNATLTAIVLAQLYHNKALPILLGLLVCTILTHIFEQATLPALTAPFVLACWFTISIKPIKVTITPSSTPPSV